MDLASCSYSTLKSNVQDYCVAVCPKTEYGRDMLGARSTTWRYSVVVITWDSDVIFPKPRFEPW